MKEIIIKKDDKEVTLVDKEDIIDALSQKSSTEHSHGDLQKDGTIGTNNNVNKNVVTNSEGKITTEPKVPVPEGNSDNTKIQMDGEQSAGISSDFARADHIHPSDISRAPAIHTHSQIDITDLDVPTKISDLENDSDFITENDISEFTNIPTKTSDLENDGDGEHPFLTQHQDISNKANIDDIPTKVSDLDNDSNFVTEDDIDEFTNVPTKTSDLENDGDGERPFITEHQDISGKANKNHTHSSSDILDSTIYSNIGLSTEATQEEINTAIDAKISTFVTSDVIDDIIAGDDIDLTGYLKQTDVKNNLISLDTNKPLSAMQGKILNETLSNKANTNDIPTKTSDLENDSGFLTEHQDISNKANINDIPTKTSDLENDSNFLTEHQDISNKANVNDIPTKTSDLENDSNFLTEHQDISGKEDTSNRVTTISSNSTDNQYPSAKLLYNQLKLKQDASSAFSGDYNDLNNKPGVSDIGAEVTVEKQQTAETGYASTYIVKQNNTIVGKININKDKMLQSATYETVGDIITEEEEDANLTTGDKYIKLIVNTTDNDDASILILPINDIFDLQTADETSLTLNNNGIFSIKDNGINSNKLKDSAVTANKINAKSINLSKLDDSVYETAYGGERDEKLITTNDSRLTDARTPVAHTNATANNIGAATTTVYGHTKLSSATNSASEDLAATPKAVQSAYNLANSKSTVSFTQTKTSGIEIGTITINGTAQKIYQQDNNTTYSTATTSTNGLMPSGDKAKMDKSTTIRFGVASGTSSAFTTTISGLTIENGTLIALYNELAANAANATLSVNGGTAKPIYYQANAIPASRFPKQATCLFVYNTNLVSTGCWQLIYSYNSNTTYSNATSTTNGLMSSGDYNTLHSLSNYSHPNSGVTAGTNYDGSQTPSFGGTFKIPKLTFNAQGHITGSTTSNVTLPSLPTATTAVAGIIKIGTGASDAAAGNHTHSYAPSTHNHDGTYLKTGTGTVTSTNIVDKTIVNGDIADTTITGSKLANATITATQLASNAVETAKIKDGAVTNAKITSITKSKISDLTTASASVNGLMSSTDKNTLDAITELNGTKVTTSTLLNNWTGTITYMIKNGWCIVDFEDLKKTSTTSSLEDVLALSYNNELMINTHQFANLDNEATGVYVIVSSAGKVRARCLKANQRVSGSIIFPISR